MAGYPPPAGAACSGTVAEVPEKLQLLTWLVSGTCRGETTWRGGGAEEYCQVQYGAIWYIVVCIYIVVYIYIEVIIIIIIEVIIIIIIEVIITADDDDDDIEVQYSTVQYATVLYGLPGSPSPGSPP